MPQREKIPINIFKLFITSVVKLNDQEVNYLYEIYDASVDSINSLSQSKIIDGIDFVNYRELISYILGEYLYSTAPLSEEKKAEFLLNEQYQTSMASVVTDKYLSLSRFNYHERNLGNRFSPPISSLNLYLNFMLNILQNYQKNNPRSTLINDLLIKSISIARCILDLLINGYETEAFASWRTLHECECTLIVLANSSQEVIDVYLKHMRYGLIYQKGHSDTPEEEATFLQMKEEMKSHDLKSKDMKKFIEYGWMYAVEGVNDVPDFKLNFRDGLEKLAHLSSYNQRYVISSEIIHSTPMLIYSSKNYYYFLTLLSTYESFFRLEPIFVKLFSRNADEEALKRYDAIKKVYYTQLVNIYKREIEAFKGWQKSRSLNKKEN